MRFLNGFAAIAADYDGFVLRSEEHTSELQSRVDISYAVFCLKKIDKKDSNVLLFNNKYRFNLIYSQSREGFDCTTFNNKCNEQGPFVILVKVQSKKIYGGYNPIGYALRRTGWMT